MEKKTDQPVRPPRFPSGLPYPKLGAKNKQSENSPPRQTKRAPVKAARSKGSLEGQPSRAENSDNDCSILPKHAAHTAAQPHPCRLQGTPASSSIPGFQRRPSREPRLSSLQEGMQPTSLSQHQRSLWARGPLPPMAVFRWALL